MPELLVRMISGRGPALFLALSLDDSQAIAESIDADVAVYRLAASATGARTIEAMAAQWVEAIRHVQPDGPYRLAGRDFGALLAYEAAAQLLGVDATVEWLGLVDPVHTQASAGDADYEIHPIAVSVSFIVTQEIALQYVREWAAILPLTQVLNCTLTGLGACVVECLKNSAVARVEVDAYTPLIKLQGGRTGEVPIFCIPGAGGNVASFTDLSIALGASTPVYGLQPRGLDGGHVPHVTVEAAAQSYVRSISEAVPAGPIRLMGHSFGGWTAFETALSLSALGRPLASLTLIDSAAICDDSVCVEYTNAEILLKLVDIFDQAAVRPLDIGADEIYACGDGSERLALLHERMVRAGLLPLRSQARSLGGMLRTFAACLRTRYVPRTTYGGSVELICLDDPKCDTGANLANHATRRAAWSHWAPRLTTWRGPGNHITAMQASNAQFVGLWLRTCWLVG